MIPESSEGNFSLSTPIAYEALGEIIEILDHLREHSRHTTERIESLDLAVTSDAQLKLKLVYDTEEQS